MEPQAYAMFRKNQAMISFEYPKQLKDGKLAMFMNAAIYNSTTGKMDWDSKIVSKLDQNDCGKLAYGLAYRKDVKIFHQIPNKPSKIIEIKNEQNNIRLSISQSEPRKYVFVNLMPEEIIILQVLFKEAIKKLNGWI